MGRKEEGERRRGEKGFKNINKKKKKFFYCQ
jgi:hypothetical protein